MTHEANWIRDQFPSDFKGWAVEVGAWDGINGSHVHPLEQLGWETLAVEPNPDCEPSIREHRKRYWMGACDKLGSTGRKVLHRHLDSPSGFTSLRPTYDHPASHPSPDAKWDQVEVEVKSLEFLLGFHLFPRLDALVIDTEGTELDVLNGLDISHWKPKVLVVESWSEGGPVRGWMADHGYQFHHRYEHNDCFLRAPRVPL